MTKKDYILISGAIREAKEIHGKFAEDHAALDTFTVELCRLLQNDNPLFDRERFLKACLPHEKANA